jgi:hypothetical protein
MFLRRVVGPRVRRDWLDHSRITAPNTYGARLLRKRYHSILSTIQIPLPAIDYLK